ncbi:DNA phosphorothioation-dependent restriction protein DptF [Oceanobacillus kapialis]|uniref:DNA phosphorothioation-dependent restriction protein DptF n=1 Tax=Oceanobacillus kapialis TaxID=481353 RepID=UPI00384F95A4
MSKFVEFLKEINTPAAQYANEMENIIFQDPSSAIVKARKFAETILNEVFSIEKIEEPYIKSFYEKVSYLTKEEYIKRETQKSLDTIRMVGNKAAHPGQQNDLADAYKLHREMYNIAVWFYEVYSDSEKQVKVPVYETPQLPKQENVEELIQQKISELLGKQGGQNISVGNDNQPVIEKVIEGEKPDILNKDLEEGQSYLLREIRRLKDSSQEAIENANQFSHFKEYLHVDRKVQLDLEKVLEENLSKDQGSLVLLCGNVGDGKSHLLAYLKEKKPWLIENYTIFNDATESFSPGKDAMQTLEETLNEFSDQKLSTAKGRVILAINMGVLHNFISTNHERYTYESLKKFIDDSKLFTPKITTHFSKGSFDLLSFGDYHSYELTESGPISTFYSSLLEKITRQSEDNTFYLALREDEKNGVKTMVQENFRLLHNKVIQEQIVNLIVQSIVKKKLVISARAFLNLVADILLPDKISNINLMSQFDMLEDSLPNLLFNRTERSDILRALGELDPLHCRSNHIDQLVIDLNTLSEWDSIIDENIKDEIPIKWLKSFISNETLMGYSFNLFFETFIRITYLTNKKFASNIADNSYLAYVKNLYNFNKGERMGVRTFYDEMKSAIFKWKGSPKKDYIYLNKPSEKFRLAQKINLRPTIEHLNHNTNDILESFKSTILIAYHDGIKGNEIFLEIDYPLYNLLTKVREGYRPNKKDEEDAIKFVEFIDKLMAFGDKQTELLVFFKADQRFYSIKRDDVFGAFVFERESNYIV